MVVFIRAILLYLIVIFALRMMGKRQIGELQPSELVTTILISNIAAIPIEDTSISMVMAVVPILVLAAFEVLLSAMGLHSKRLRSILAGKPRIIIQNGELDQKMMKQLRISLDDLLESLRAKEVFDIQDVQYAIIETNGKLSVMKKHKAQTATAEMLQIKGKDNDPPMVVVSDGVIIQTNLQNYGLTEAWLLATLRQQNQPLTEVFLMTADRNGKTFVLPRKKEEGRKKL